MKFTLFLIFACFLGNNVCLADEPEEYSVPQMPKTRKKNYSALLNVIQNTGVPGDSKGASSQSGTGNSGTNQSGTGNSGTNGIAPPIIIPNTTTTTGSSTSTKGDSSEKGGDLTDTKPEDSTSTKGDGKNDTATMQSFKNGRNGERGKMASGEIVVNGNTYKFNSGGSGNGHLPPGEYTVSGGEQTSQKGMVQGRGTADQVGYKFNLSDKYDSRVGAERSLLRIHPDENNNGTLGCIGISGNSATQRQFYSDMKSELSKNGGTTKITVR